MIKLSLLIPSLENRAGFYNRLREILDPQLTAEVEVITFIDNGERTIGAKRNWLLKKAKGEYIAFIDDDDRVSTHYVSKVMEGIDKGVDACSLIGIITEDGLNPKKFIHSNKYNSWFEIRGIYYRCVNHLNCVRKSIALQIMFPEKNKGEDHDYSMRLNKANIIKSEHEIEEAIYFYEFRTKK